MRSLKTRFRVLGFLWGSIAGAAFVVGIEACTCPRATPLAMPVGEFALSDATDSLSILGGTLLIEQAGMVTWRYTTTSGDQAELVFQRVAVRQQSTEP